MLSTEDFLAIDALYHERSLNEKMLSRLSRLTEMGIVEHIGRKSMFLQEAFMQLPARLACIQDTLAWIETPTRNFS